MAHSLAAKQAALASQAFELMLAAPQVVAHRMTRIALGQPLASDRADFNRMGREKAEAATEMFNGMAAQALRTGNNAAASYAQAWWKAWMAFCFPLLHPGSRARFPVWGMTPGQMQHATLDVMGKAMVPVRRRTVANARRLAKRRRS